MTIAGSDSGAGAGLQADLKTFAALGVFGVSVVTAITAQNTAEVRGIQLVDPEFVELQAVAVLDDMPVAAVKTGMLGSERIIARVAALAGRSRLPNLVVDPVAVASTGRRMIDSAGIDAYLNLLLPHALIVTPNIFEASLLAGMPVEDRDAMEHAARKISSSGARFVVVKGGHLDGPESADLVYHDGEVTMLSAQRVRSANNHGTGCTFSAATAALLAKGMDPLQAMREAKLFVTRAISASAGWRLGSGHGPLNHFAQ